MAKSTASDGKKLPKGMMAFRVIRSTIKDSLGNYCTVDDMAVLDKKLAQHYLDNKFIRVELPDFDEDDFDGNEPDTDKEPDDPTGTEGERGKSADGNSTDDQKQPETPTPAGGDGTKGRARR